MKKIISIMLIGMMIVGCGKTARLNRLEKERAEVAEEQARVNKLSSQEGGWKWFTNHVHNNALTYLFIATAFVAVVGVGAFIYHRHKKKVIPTGEDLNNPQVEVQQEEAHQAPQPEHLEENAQFPPADDNDQGLANMAEQPMDGNAAQLQNLHIDAQIPVEIAAVQVNAGVPENIIENLPLLHQEEENGIEEPIVENQPVEVQDQINPIQNPPENVEIQQQNVPQLHGQQINDPDVGAQMQHEDPLAENIAEPENEIHNDGVQNPIGAPVAIPVPQGNNIPQPNNNPHPEHRLKHVYGFPFKVFKNTRKKPTDNPKENKLTWRNTRRIHSKHPNQQEPSLSGKVSYVFPKREKDLNRCLMILNN